MGVEYSHGLFVADTSWLSSWRHVEQIHAVLTRWGFRRADPPFFALDGDDCDEIDAATVARGLPPNLMVVYDSLEGAAVPKVIGASMHKSLADSDRYIMSTLLYLGADYKVVQAEGEEVEIHTTIGADPDFVSAMPTVVEVYPATWTTPRPTSNGPSDFDRIWRCGLVLDCNKDVPAIATKAEKLPARDFVRQLEEAFGTRLVELGWLH